MTRWFGESWGAPVCEPDEHVETPVGMQCIGHDHLHAHRPDRIEAGDQGVLLPKYDGPQGEWGTVAFHLDCWLHEVGADRVRQAIDAAFSPEARPPGERPEHRQPAREPRPR